MLPPISIIMPVYNQRKHLLEVAARSAINQIGVEGELIIINDGSTDNCMEVLNFVPSSSNIEIKVISRVENGGVAAALNDGIKASQNEYIAWLPSDDYFMPEKTLVQLSNMIEAKTLFSFTAFHQLVWENGVLTEVQAVPTPYPSGKIGAVQLHQALLNRFPSCFLNGASIMVHKEVFNKVGLFDEDLKYTQDYDMWLKITEYYDTFVNADALMVKNIHDNQMEFIFKNKTEQRAIEEGILKKRYLS